MWIDEPSSSFNGKYYQIKNTYCNPKPVQEPSPRIMIGGTGERQTLRIVAKYCDVCSLFGSVETVKYHTQSKSNSQELHFLSRCPSLLCVAKSLFYQLGDGTAAFPLGTTRLIILSSMDVSGVNTSNRSSFSARG